MSLEVKSSSELLLLDFLYIEIKPIVKIYLPCVINECKRSQKDFLLVEVMVFLSYELS